MPVNEALKALREIDSSLAELVELSELDTRLGESYGTAKQYASTASGKQLVDGQLQWLRSVRDKCSDAACLLRVYKGRINELDPFADQAITCEEMRQFPQRIFSASIDLGSGFGSPTEVDYGCPESLNGLQFIHQSQWQVQTYGPLSARAECHQRIVARR